MPAAQIPELLTMSRARLSRSLPLSACSGALKAVAAADRDQLLLHKDSNVTISSCTDFLKLWTLKMLASNSDHTAMKEDMEEK